MGAVSNNSKAAAVMLSMLLIMMLGGHEEGEGLVKAILLLFLHLPELRIKYKRNFHHIQFGIY